MTPSPPRLCARSLLGLKPSCFAANTTKVGAWLPPVARPPQGLNRGATAGPVPLEVPAGLFARFLREASL